MTVLAVVTTVDVCGVLAGRYDAIVTIAAGTHNLRMVNRVCWNPDIRIVAILAHIGRLHMGWILARSLNSIVTAHAVPGNPDVVKVRWQPPGGCVAVVAIIAARYVGRVFSSRDTSVMA